MITFDGPVAGQKSIGLHIELLISYLHHKGRTQVNEVGIPDIGEQCIRKTMGVLLQQLIKTGLPEKVDEAFQSGQGFYPVVIIFKMINMKKLDVLQGRTLVC